MGENWESLQLPIANVERIMKKIIPQKGKISKEAKKTMQECANEFISFVTSEAAQKCHNENRRTLNGDDIYWAFGSLGLDNYAEASSMLLLKFREAERIKASDKAITFQHHQHGVEDHEYNYEHHQLS
ncbi:beta-galactosidase 15-like [Cucumis melo var. makuwa]|uniref:Beta-galactosidase 15-like n=2 Tax=Cucumis melo TaxID=3656 RepID=A0A5D3CFV4_CUCMM|nr:nuclear transcription factor Y subunit B-4-like [Cucumis melo]KAA0050888.1 beta-galactosidase 15-like [Cucumis melo var. makuwa]TYK10240.1 beta-galactosidase 15-like [Cucumis melo var. makuwa]